MTDTMSGGCPCGRVRFAATIHDDDAYLCHCMSQRATGGAFSGNDELLPRGLGAH
jgi:hypothetical protein